MYCHVIQYASYKIMNVGYDICILTLHEQAVHIIIIILKSLIKFNQCNTRFFNCF